MKTYGEIQYKNGEWHIIEAEPHVRIKLKNIFKRIPAYAVPPYIFADTPEQCADLQWFMSRYPLSISRHDELKLKRKSKSFYNLQSEMEAIMQGNLEMSALSANVSLKEGQALRPYQTQGVELSKRQQRILIGDDVGLGKTYLGIGFMFHKEHLPALVVVKTHLWKQWQTKIEEFSHLCVHVIHGRIVYTLPAADVYVVKYSCLSSWVDIFDKMPFQTIIFDEIQELRRGTASGKGAVSELLSGKASYVLGLSATPIYNYGDEIYNVCDILKKGSLGTREEFLREWSTDGRIVKDPDALGTYLREKYLLLRRTKKDVGRFLQEVNTVVDYVEFDEENVRKAEEIAVQLAIKASAGSFIERGKAARELDLKVRHFTGVSKARYVAEYVKILLEAGEPILLAGWHRDVWDIWLNELKSFDPVMYTGTESSTQKERSKEAFMKGDTNLMFISLRSGEGLDGLQERCSIVVHGELDWSPMIHYQVVGRLDREGQNNPPVTSIYLVSDSGSDPLIMDVLGLKSSQARGINDPGLGAQAVYNDRTRVQLLIDKYLKKKGGQLPGSVVYSDQEIALNYG